MASTYTRKDTDTIIVLDRENLCGQVLDSTLDADLPSVPMTTAEIDAYDASLARLGWTREDS